MVIGFLHLGKPEHGVRRFGQILAREAKRRTNLKVIEVELTLSGSSQDLLKLTEAATVLSSAQIAHIQFTEEIWGHNPYILRNLRQFLTRCRSSVVVTIHDTEPVAMNQSSILEFRITRFQAAKIAIENFIQQAKRSSQQWLYDCRCFDNCNPDNAWIRQWIIGHTQLSIVCTEEEKQRLTAANIPRQRVVVIPHFVEHRAQLPGREYSRTTLNLQNRQVITLLGFIFGGKGHHLLLQALSLLPNPNLLLVFAGGVAPGSELILEELISLAHKLKVINRLRITGYLEERELEQYLMATDVPVCPFEICFASGSFSTWISAGRLVLTSDLPQFREYSKIEPGSLRLFAPYTAPALATAIESMLLKPKVDVGPAVQQLRDRLSIQKSFDQHLYHYSK